MVPKCWWHENHHFNFSPNLYLHFYSNFLIKTFCIYYQSEYIIHFYLLVLWLWTRFVVFCRWGLINPNLLFQLYSNHLTHLKRCYMLGSHRHLNICLVCTILFLQYDIFLPFCLYSLPLFTFFYWFSFPHPFHKSMSIYIPVNIFI